MRPNHKTPLLHACAGDDCWGAVDSITFNGRAVPTAYQRYGPGRMVFKATGLKLWKSEAEGKVLCFTLR